MAEAVVSFVVKRVGDLLIQEAIFLGGVSDQVEEMQRELKRMQLFLEDADKRQQDQSKSLQGWISEIREVAYDAEGVIETFALEVASRREKGFKKKFKRYATIFSEGAKIHRVGKEIDAIRNKITGLTASLQTYGIIQVKEEGASSSPVIKMQQQLRRSYSHLVDEHVVGLGKDIKTLVAKLVTEGKQGSQIVSLCGMGGLGKTTLANKLYHHDEVRQYFDGFAWACISQQFQARDVWEGILIKLVSASSEEREEISRMRDDEIAKELYHVQQKKKCLVILDDIWRENAWDLLRPAFPIGNAAASGSKIVLTTRNKAVALHVDSTCFLHTPPTLTEEESWELLQKKTFRRKDFPDIRISTDMENLGRKMVGRCAGLPLAIIVLGGILATKQSFNEWNMVHENFELYLRRGKGQEQEDSGVPGVLALSYHELPFRLKPCFLHLGNFPEDYEIPTETLIQMWVAEGFVRSVQYDIEGKETMEELAEHYLGELMDRCMVQVGKLGSNGKVKTCHVHDLMRDLCLLKAKQENFLEIVRSQNENEHAVSTRSSHRLAMYAKTNSDSSFHERSPYLRSLLYFTKLHADNPTLIFKSSNFRFLRILSLHNCNIGRTLAKEIGYLIHLRYLAFEEGCTVVMDLPSSLGNLRYLQTLRIVSNKCNRIFIPKEVWTKLVQLRHVWIPLGFLNLRTNKGKCRLGNSRDLQTVEGFNTAEFDLKDLVKLTNLRRLSISFSTFLSLDEFEEILQSPSVDFNNLLVLHIDIFYWMWLCEKELKPLLSKCRNLWKLYIYGKVVLKLPEYQYFPSNLTKLTLVNSDLREDPMVTLEKLPNLKILKLWGAFEGTEIVCSSKGFPQLKTLLLRGLKNLEEWDVDEEAMPSLYRLCIVGCDKLKMVPDGLSFLTTLTKLEITRMPESFVNRIRGVNGGGGEDLYKVQHVPYIIIC